MIRTVLKNHQSGREDRLDEDRLAFPAPSDMDAAALAEITWSSSGASVSYRAKGGAQKTQTVEEPRHLSLLDKGSRVLLSANFRAPSEGKESCPLCEILRHE
jgi:hypothetical protein